MPASRTTRASLLALAWAVLLCHGPTSARAGLVVTVVSSSALAGGVGSFDVNLSNIGGTTSYEVSGFSVELSVPAGSGITFTGANVSTALPYLFGTLQTPPLTFSTFPNTDFIAGDSSQTSPFYTTLSPGGGSFGLEHVSYAVAPGTALGPVTVSIVGLGSTTEILAIDGTPFPSSSVNGTITVTSVPEPSSLFLLSAGLIAASLAVGRRRRSTTSRSS